MSGFLGNTTPVRVLTISVLTVLIAVSGGLIFLYANCVDCEFSPRIFLTMAAGGVSLLLFVVGLGLSFVGLIRLLVYTLKAGANPNDMISEAPYWVRWNRNNLLFCPKYLNEHGLDARRKAFNGLLLFATGVALAIPAILVTETF
jgi:hypothetical protein